MDKDRKEKEKLFFEMLSKAARKESIDKKLYDKLFDELYLNKDGTLREDLEEEGDDPTARETDTELWAVFGYPPGYGPKDDSNGDEDWYDSSDDSVSPFLEAVEDNSEEETIAPKPVDPECANIIWAKVELVNLTPRTFGEEAINNHLFIDKHLFPNKRPGNSAGVFPDKLYEVRPVILAKEISSTGSSIKYWAFKLTSRRHDDYYYISGGQYIQNSKPIVVEYPYRFPPDNIWIKPKKADDYLRVKGADGQPFEINTFLLPDRYWKASGDGRDDTITFWTAKESFKAEVTSKVKKERIATITHLMKNYNI